MDFDWQVSLQVLGVNVSGFEESLPDLRYCGGKCIGLVGKSTSYYEGKCIGLVGKSTSLMSLRG